MLPETFVRLLEQVPSLVRLSVEEFHNEKTTYTWHKDILEPTVFVKDVFIKLREPGSNGLSFKLLPHLEGLELKVRIPDGEDDAVASMAVARVLDGLRVLVLHVQNRLIFLEDYDKLRGFIGKSFRAEITAFDPKHGSLYEKEEKKGYGTIW